MKSLIAYLLASLYFGLPVPGTSPAPTPSSLNVVAMPPPASINDALPAELLHAEIAAQSMPDYQPDNDGQILYFSAAGEAAKTPIAGGFTRKVLGKTADGRQVIQDYYQGSGQPQTSVTVLVKDADLADFSTDIVSGRTIWYRENGDIFSWIDFDEGKATSAVYFYQHGVLLAQLASDDSGIPGSEPHDGGVLIAQFFYANGIAMKREYHYADGSVQNFYYREDGTPIAGTHITAEQEETSSFWDKNGQSVALQDVDAEISTLFARYTVALQILADNYAAVFKGDPASNPFGASL